MKIIFNNSTEKTLINNPVEQKIYKSGEPAGWMMSLSIADITADEADEIISDLKNIEKLVFLYGENDEKSVEINGYNKVNSLSIRHTQTSSIADFQLAKGV